MLVIVFYIVLVIYLFNCVISYCNRPYTIRNRLSIVFAPPRSGKTCLATHLALHYAKRGVRVYGNVPMKLPEKYAHMYTLIDWSDVGKYDFNNCELLIDEAGVDLNNRDYKNLLKSTIKFLKYHGHYRCGMWYFSQSHNDMDITVRKLADDYYVVGKTLLFPFTHTIKMKHIIRTIGINKMTNQIEDIFQFSKFSTYRFNAKKVFNMFNSYSTYYLPPHPDDVGREDYKPSNADVQ